MPGYFRVRDQYKSVLTCQPLKVKITNDPPFSFTSPVDLFFPFPTPGPLEKRLAVGREVLPVRSFAIDNRTGPLPPEPVLSQGDRKRKEIPSPAMLTIDTHSGPLVYRNCSHADHGGRIADAIR